MSIIRPFLFLLPLIAIPFARSQSDYTTVLGSDGQQHGIDIEVDAQGYAFVLAYDYQDHHRVTIAKINPDGQLDNMFHVPVTGFAYTSGMALDTSGNLYITGWTSAGDFPTFNAYQPEIMGSSDAFLLKLDGDDGQILWSTFLGGTHPDRGIDVAISPSGTVVVVGATASPDFPTVDPIQGQLNLTSCFCDDVFVTEFTATGDQIQFSTYLGGRRDDQAGKVALDASGRILVAGRTLSPDFPASNPIQASFGGEEDGFLFAIDSDREQLSYSSYLGGEAIDRIGDLHVDAAGNALVVGTTRSLSFPTTPGALMPDFVGGIGQCGGGAYNPIRNCDDQFLVKLDPFGQQVFGTYLGGNRDDVARGVAATLAGNIFLIGYTTGDYPGATGLPIPGATIVTAELDPLGTSLIQTRTTDSPVANAGLDIAILGDRVFWTGADEVPANLLVASYAIGEGESCLNFAAPAGIGIEDLLVQISYWQHQDFAPDMDLNQDGRLNLNDSILIMALMGSACP